MLLLGLIRVASVFLSIVVLLWLPVYGVSGGLRCWFGCFCYFPLFQYRAHYIFVSMLLHLRPFLVMYVAYW